MIAHTYHSAFITDLLIEFQELAHTVERCHVDFGRAATFFEPARKVLGSRASEQLLFDGRASFIEASHARRMMLCHFNDVKPVIGLDDLAHLSGFEGESRFVKLLCVRVRSE